MVALNFMKRFASDVERGIKLRTFRLDGKRRPPRAGETLQLYTGMRTKSCRLLATAPCTYVQPCILRVGRKQAWGVSLCRDTAGGGRAVERIDSFHALDDFAKLDGFRNWSELVAFFAPRADGAGQVKGQLIHWRLP
jgi:hypothetical protein